MGNSKELCPQESTPQECAQSGGGKSGGEAKGDTDANDHGLTSAPCHGSVSSLLS